MTDASPETVQFKAEIEPPPGGGLRRFWSFARGFWTGDRRWQAWGLTLAIVALVLLNIAIQYSLNLWNRFFFDSLDHKNPAAVMQAVGLFAGLAFTAISSMVVLVLCRMTLQAQWRRWLTLHLLGDWLEDRRFYQMNITAPELDNPEFRMTDDVRIATEPVVDFAIGLGNAVLMAAVFIGVLWTAGGAITVFGVDVPGYFVLAAMAYASLTSGAMLLLGRPLIDRTEAKNAAEASVRFALVRVRENAESIALIGGEEDEQRTITARLDETLGRWGGVITQQARMTWIIHGNTVLAPIVPLLLGAPKYLAGDLTLGALMQLAAAFLQVQLALNWLVENYIRLAEWIASANRVSTFAAAMSDLDDRTRPGERILVETGRPGEIRLRDLSVAQFGGRVVINGAEAVFSGSEKILIQGDSGTGKSTLIRAVAGLWPWGSGRILMPPGATVMFVPQKPYVPSGTLREALLYPDTANPREDRVLLDALHRCGLRHLASRLDEVEPWARILSGGELQRLAFARLVVHRPAVIIMDEATSALDEASQDSMMSLFKTELAGSMLLSVGHRPGLAEYHDRVIVLSRGERGARVSEASSSGVARLLGEVIKRGLRPRPSADPGASRAE